MTPKGLPSAPGNPLSNGLLVKNRAWNAFLRMQDVYFTRLARTRGATRTSSVPPRKLLIGVGGHLGDAVIATSALALLRAHAPEVEIGIVSGGWNRPVFAGHDRVRWFHQLDHWKLNRGAVSFAERWAAARRSSAAALREIREVGYDAAVDLSPYYPNAARLFWRAGIASRTGYATGGGGPLHTQRLVWEPGRPVTQDHLALLRAVFPRVPADAPMDYDLPRLRDDAAARTRAMLEKEGLVRGRYVVIHPGAGLARKEWPADNWTSIVTELERRGVGVALTGAGDEQGVLAARIARGATTAVNLANRLSWEEFRGVIADARAVLSVDTVAMHIAAAEGVPCVALMTSMDAPARWRPPGARSAVVTAPVRCAPCFRSRGCEWMSCVRDITARDVLDALETVNGR